MDARHGAGAGAGVGAAVVTHAALMLLLLLAVLRGAAAQAIQDSRCYLMNGGAVESFYISEDTPVGSVIGTLSVNGNPDEASGDVTLRLQEKGAAVAIAPGTKNVTLRRALDREERQGPSNVYVNVRCDRRRTTDPSFIIPVSVRVWDVNDNPPVWHGAPYRLRLSELTAVGARVLPNARATDADQPGPHATIHYSVLPGPYSDYFAFPNELDSALVVAKPLDFETLSNFSVTLRAQDAGTPPLHSDAELRVEVLDADDQNPRFSHDHFTAILPDDAQEGTILVTQPGPVAARDQDRALDAPLEFASTGERRHLLTVERDSGRVAATRQLLEATDLPVTVVIKATQVDNPDRYALATLTVSRAGRAGALTSPTMTSSIVPLRFSRRAFFARAREDAAPGFVLTTLTTEPARAADGSPLQFYVSDRSFLEKFAINSLGEVLLRRPLDFEATDAYFYQVMVTDGITNDTASLNISVANVNEWEPRFRYPQYEFRVDDAQAPAGAEGGGGEGGGLLPVGKLDVHDGDRKDTVTLTLRGADAGMFYINGLGEMFLRREALTALNASVLHVVATAQDSGEPPRQTSVPVLVHVGERLLAARTGLGARSAALIGAAALALMAAAACALLVFVYRSKRCSKASPAPSPSSKSVAPARSPAPRSPPGTNPGASAAPGARAAPCSALGASAGSLLSVSAGASTILANSSSSLDLRGDSLPNQGNGTRSATVGRQSQRFPTKTKIAPAPPSLTDGCDVGLPPSSPPGGMGGVTLMSDHLRGASAASRSGVAWPSATIPARVKKLSWDDAGQDDQLTKGSPRPLDATNPALHDHLNLTVYF